MSPKLPSLKTRDVIKLVEAQGFYKVRQKGSHARYVHPDGRSTVIPIHAGKTIGDGLLLQILADIGINPNEIRR